MILIVPFFTEIDYLLTGITLVFFLFAARTVE